MFIDLQKGTNISMRRSGIIKFTVVLALIISAVAALTISSFAALTYKEQDITIEEGTVGVFYKQSEDMTGKVPEKIEAMGNVFYIRNVKIKSITVKSGQVPPGLTISHTNTSATFEGTPTKAGTYVFKVVARISATVSKTAGGDAIPELNEIDIPVNVTMKVKPGEISAPTSAIISGGKDFKTGDTLSYSCLTNGSELTYKWYIKRANSSDWLLAGEGSKFVVTNLTTFDNGMKIKCEVSNKKGSVTSNVAEITVKPAKCSQHTYGAWTQLTAPTCLNGGVEQRVCTVCKEVETRTINPLGHKFSTEWTIEKHPGCVESGIRSHRCTRCQEKDEATIENISPVGHNYGSWVVAKEATKTEEGLERRTCVNCKDVDERSIPKVVDGHTHSFSDWKETKKATCTSKGERTRSCSCGEVQTEATPLLNHNYPNGYTTIKEATCSEAGVRAKVCTVCKKQTDTQTIPVKEHSFGNWKVVKEPTVFAEGEERRQCSACGYTESKTVAKLVEGHTHSFGEWTVEKVATCIEEGKEVRSCACGAVENRNTSKKDHSYGEWIIVKAPTVNDNGIETRTCIYDGCKESESRTIDKLPQVNPTPIVPDTTKPADTNTSPVPTETNDGLDMEMLKYISVGAGGVFAGIVLVFVIVVLRSHRKSRWE